MPGPAPLHASIDALRGGILRQTGAGGLAALAAGINSVAGRLIELNTSVEHITHAISDLNDRLIARVLELTEIRLGPPPVPYSWILAGSEGRREQTFKTDQDNALVFADPADAAADRIAQQYFRDFTAAAVDDLVTIGFPRCPAGYMASTAEWRRPLSAWKAYFSDWMDTPVPNHLLKCQVFLDFRPVYGEARIARELRESVTRAAPGKPIFLGHLANATLEFAPPVGFFRTFVVEKAGVHKDQLDLKVRGMSPLVNAVRFLAVSKGVAETGTSERLHALRDMRALGRDDCDELARAFEVVMGLRIRHQHEQLRRGGAPDNFIDPDDLSADERKRLKDSFSAMSRVQALILELYRAFVR